MPDISLLSIADKQVTLQLTSSKLYELKMLQMLKAAFNWLLCLLLLFLMLSQLLTVGLSVSANTFDVFYERSPVDGTYAIPGYNDEPYSDRLLAYYRKKGILKSRP